MVWVRPVRKADADRHRFEAFLRINYLASICWSSIGLLLLLTVCIRVFRGHFSPEKHNGLEVPGIYWHFVDIMWIIVFLAVYIV